MGQTTYANTLSQMLALGPTKLSVLLFYRRIFRGRSFDIASWSLIVLVVIWTVAFFITNLIVCLPIIPWDVPGAIVMAGGECMQATDMFLAQSYADFSLDFLILILPLPLIAKLHMRLSRKVQIGGVFLVGLVTLACSVTTAIQYGVAEQYNAGNTDVTSKSNFARNTSIAYIHLVFEMPIVYWPLIEAAMGIVAACLMTIRSLVEGWSQSPAVVSMRNLLHKRSITFWRSSEDTLTLKSMNSVTKVNTGPQRETEQ